MKKFRQIMKVVEYIAYCVCSLLSACVIVACAVFLLAYVVLP